MSTTERPTTEAALETLMDLHAVPQDWLRRRLVRIEAEARALPAEPTAPTLDDRRLAEAMAVAGITDGDGLPRFDLAERVAAEYQNTVPPTVDGGRIARHGWHYSACWQGWASAWYPDDWDCICENLAAEPDGEDR